MTDEMRIILNGIGYEKALRYNRGLAFQMWEPDDYGGQIFKNKVEAREGIAYLHQLMEMLENCPTRLRQILNSHAKSPDDWDTGRDPLYDAERGIIDVLSYAELEQERYWSGRGASKRIASESIARQMAEIFVLGMGEKPTTGATDTGAPSGKFPTAVQDMLACVGSPDNFRRPCQAALIYLEQNNEHQFKRLMSMRALKGQKVSLFSMTVRN